MRTGKGKKVMGALSADWEWEELIESEDTECHDGRTSHKDSWSRKIESLKRRDQVTYREKEHALKSKIKGVSNKQENQSLQKGKRIAHVYNCQDAYCYNGNSEVKAPWKERQRKNVAENE